MTDLHWALAGIALLVLAALYGYGKVQERRARLRLEAGLRGPLADTLLQPPPVAADGPALRVEPSFGALDVADAPAPEAVADTEPAPAPLVERDSDWVEDPMLDCVLELRCSHAVDGVTVIDASTQLARVDLGQPIRLAAWDGRTQRWVEPDRFGFYTEVLLGTQLAHRGRCLGELDIAHFIAAGQQMAVALDADFDPPDAGQVLQQAHALAAQIAEFDVLLGLTVVLAEPASRERVALAAQQLGFVVAGPERWHWPDAEGRTCFALVADTTPVDRLALEMDVPLTPRQPTPFRTMLEVAQRLAAVLGARVVDDNGRPIEPAAADAIDQRLEEHYARMRAAGIEAGELRARRLFG